MSIHRELQRVQPISQMAWACQCFCSQTWAWPLFWHPFLSTCAVLLSQFRDLTFGVDHETNSTSSLLQASFKLPSSFLQGQPDELSCLSLQSCWNASFPFSRFCKEIYELWKEEPGFLQVCLPVKSLRCRLCCELCPVVFQMGLTVDLSC